MDSLMSDSIPKSPDRRNALSNANGFHLMLILYCLLNYVKYNFCKILHFLINSLQDNADFNEIVNAYTLYGFLNTY